MSDDGSDVLDDEAETTALAESSRALHSDPHDFAGLYIRHRTAFTLLARRYLRDARDADEVVQEAFLRLFLALPELETELQALAYGRRTITNLCIDRYRTQARRPSLVDIGTIPLEELPDEDHGDPVIRAEDAALVRQALSMLSPLHRAALVKREIEEKTLPVIAQELEVPEDSVKHLLFRARRALRRLLVGSSLDPGSNGEGGLALLTRAGSGGVAGFLLLMVLGLGSGPNLEAIPVVGVDLPEIIPVTDIARSVGSAVTDAVSTSDDDGEDGADDGLDRGDDPAPQVAVDPTPSPTATTPTAVPVEPSPSTSPKPSSTPEPAPDPTVPGGPAPADEPSAPSEPSAPPSPSAAPAGSPSAPASPTAEPTKAPEPTEAPSEAPPSTPPSPTETETASPEAEPEVLPTRAAVPTAGRLQEVSEAP